MYLLATKHTEKRTDDNLASGCRRHAT